MDNFRERANKLSAIEIYAYSYKVRMLWQGRTDKLIRKEYPFLIWLSNRFSSAPNIDINQHNFRNCAFDKSLHEQYANELEKNLLTQQKTNVTDYLNRNTSLLLSKLLRLCYR